MAKTSTHRTLKRANPVDVTAFSVQVQRATTAFQNDVSYAVLMARAAVTIEKKRRGWQTRHSAEPVT